MHSSTSLSVLFGLAVWLNMVFAAPLGNNTISIQETKPAVQALYTRTLGDSRFNAIPAKLNCLNIPELCDANCYAILCQNQPRILQKVDDDTTDDNRKAAGVTQQPFDQKPAQMQALGVTRPNVRHRSAEEYPFASTAQGGYGANLFPVKQAQQNSQGGYMSSMYAKYGIDNGDWYRLDFDNINSPYCNALKVEDTSICEDKDRGVGDWGFDFGMFDYRFAGIGSQPQYGPNGKQFL